MSSWRNRIVGYGEEDPEQLLANPANWRVHPKNQQDALAGVLDEVGWVDDILVNRTTGHVVDGHLRVTLSLRRGEKSVPVKYVELSEEEEHKILATLDPLAALAVADREALGALLQSVQSSDAAVQEMLSGLAEREGMFFGGNGKSWDDVLGGLPDGDRAPFQQMTFTLHDEQVEIVKAALAIAKSVGKFEDSPNQNSNGNALALICETFVGLNDGQG